jgi:hypothetical protein
MKLIACSRGIAFITLSLLVNAFSSASPARAAGADYDGNGFAEIPILTPGAGGSLEWKLFDPASGVTTTFLPSFGKLGDALIIANYLYPKVTSAGVLSLPNAKSGGRLVWTIRTNVVKKGAPASTATIMEHHRYLGRKGDVIVTGGDFDGNKIADALVLARRGNGLYTWGLRANLFLSSYNPGSGSNRAYFDFGVVGRDIPFYLNPEGKGDWFALLQPQGDTYQVVMMQPFSKVSRTINVGQLQDGSHPPLPLQQDDGSDYLVFYSTSGDSTNLVIKNLRGDTVSTFEVPITGTVTVGNYGPGAGEEIAVISGERYFIVNPITGRMTETSGPQGIPADTVNINTLR